MSLWLEEARKRVDGAYGAKPSVVQPFENPSYSALGVRIKIKAEFLYDILVILEIASSTSPLSAGRSATPRCEASSAA